MGSRGPIRRSAMPAQLRIVETEDTAHGPRPDSAADRVPLAAPATPPELSGDLADLYRVTAENLDTAGLASPLDAMALGLAITHYGAAMEAARELDSEGPVVTGANGGPVVNPAHLVLKSQSSAFAELAKGLGLTFGARARITLPRQGDGGTDDGNPFSGKAAAGA